MFAVRARALIDRLCDFRFAGVLWREIVPARNDKRDSAAFRKLNSVAAMKYLRSVRRGAAEHRRHKKRYQRVNSKRFRSKVRSGHKGAAVEVPFDPAKEWDSRPQRIRPGRRGHAVIATLNGIRFESHIVARSHRFWLLVEASVLRAAKVEIGDIVNISVPPNGRDEV